MKIVYSYQGKEAVFDKETSEIIIGRPRDEVAPDLDLTPDLMVSRPHARVWVEYGLYWIEDLGSLRDTLVNGEQIKDKGKRRLHPGDIICIGETTLHVEIPAEQIDPYATHPILGMAKPIEEVTLSLDASIPALASPQTDFMHASQRLVLFYELSLQFAEETSLNALLQRIVERVVDVIPGAERGALLVKDPTTGKLALKAHLPPGQPAVSLTMAQQAMEKCRAFIWPPPPIASASDEYEKQLPVSIVEYRIESAMYSPLVWKGDILGVVCVDNCETCGAFNTDELRLLQAVANLAAMAVANLQLQKRLQQQVEAQENILKLVSPQIAERLKRHRGKIRLGGEFHDATILFSDIRGFTNLSSTMSPDDVADLLEDYFSRLVPVVFKYQGTIDKFVGDAILAVFGSPDTDEHQHIHALQAALEMQETMREVSTQRARQGKCTGELGIGIHCGEIVHGFIGSSERMEFTVIGDTVNRASRYCDGALAGEVLISPEVYETVWNIVVAEQTSITTKHEGELPAYRIKSIKHI